MFDLGSIRSREFHSVQIAAAVSVDPLLTQLTDVKPLPVRWLWPRRLPLAKLTLLVGDPGLGKSQVSIDAAARVTTGGSSPDGTANDGRGSVLITSGEDGASDTMLPRLLAAGGKPDGVTVLHGARVHDCTNPAGVDRGLTLDVHLGAVETAIVRTGARLGIIDPLTSFLSRADSFKDAEVRGILTTLTAIAERTGAAIVAVMHRNKRADAPAVYRLGASIAFVTAARAAHIVTTYPSDQTGTHRLFLPLKQNLSEPAPGLAYVVEAAIVHGDGNELIPISYIVWQDGEVNVTAGEALAAVERSDGDRSAPDEAIDFLRDLLSNGKMECPVVERKACTA
jgi:hypothetical protein